MSIAVTGSTGFLGRHVVSALLQRGETVRAAARRSRDFWPSQQQVQFSHVDVGEGPDAYDKLGQPSTLIHLAWGGLPRYQSDHHLDEELPKHLAFLKSCVAAGLRHIVVSGTCLEYGMREGCQSEEMPAAPVIAYAIAKHRLHQGLRALQSTFEFKVTWLRLFYMYGPGQAPTSLYSQLNAAIESKATHFPMSHGEQLRDFMPVESAASIISSLAVAGPTDDVVNVCSGEPRSVKSIVTEWLQARGVSMRLELGAFPCPEYEPRAFWGSTRKLQGLLGLS